MESVFVDYNLSVPPYCVDVSETLIAICSTTTYGSSTSYSAYKWSLVVLRISCRGNRVGFVKFGEAKISASGNYSISQKIGWHTLEPAHRRETGARSDSMVCRIPLLALVRKIRRIRYLRIQQSDFLYFC